MMASTLLPLTHLHNVVAKVRLFDTDGVAFQLVILQRLQPLLVIRLRLRECSLKTRRDSVNAANRQQNAFPQHGFLNMRFRHSRAAKTRILFPALNPFL